MSCIGCGREHWKESDYTNCLEMMLERATERIQKLEEFKKLPCGHPVQAAYTSEEGTSCCKWCVDVGVLKEENRKLIEIVTQRGLE